ncbi:hypothetical protein [Actinoplanes sp. DH11]|uniref:hypothetical protein n=1 Tax=Actinoplanes sp. DH11 TaxID=2857011 RepID=UPI001E3FC1A7|nr:hypothetical protein [Actinoplanes sp. DH11]
MWICAQCGEPNDDTSGGCGMCGHRPRTTEPTRWEPVPRNAPGFRGGPPPAPRNAAPAVTGRHWRHQDEPEPPPAPATDPARAAEHRAGATWIPQPADRPGPTWIPEPAEPAGQADPGRRRVLPAVPIAVLVGALAAAAVLGGPRLMDTGSDAQRPIPGRDTTRPSAPAAGIPVLENTPAPAATRLVSVGPGVTDDRAPAVAAMFETYFTGINDKDYARVAGVLHPGGELNPDDREQWARFTDGTATAEDSRVVLRELSGRGAGRFGADVTFRSEQEAGDGPPERPAETCTEWRVSYTITAAGGEYRILRGEGTSRPC